MINLRRAHHAAIRRMPPIRVGTQGIPPKDDRATLGPALRMTQLVCESQTHPPTSWGVIVEGRLVATRAPVGTTILATTTVIDRIALLTTSSLSM